MVKNLVDKLSVDAENHDFLMDNYQEGGRFKLFSNVFLGKMSAMSKTNWVMLIFCIPVIAVIFYTMSLAVRHASFTQFSANLGIGYPVVPDADEVYADLIFKNNMFRALLLLPCFIIGFIGLAGAFNVIKYESLGMSVKVWKTFFKGVKNNFVTYMWLGLINGVVFMLLIYAVNFFGHPELHLAVKIITIALCAILMAIVLIMSFYIMTQAALYNLPLSKMIKNAFYFTISFVIQNLFIFIFSMVPVALLFLMQLSYFLQLIVIMIFAFIGISYVVCVWTIYSHYIFGHAFSAVLNKNNGGGKKKKQKAK